MNAVIAWLKSKNVTSHTVAAVIVALAGALMSDEQVRNFFVSSFDQHPKLVAAVISIAGIILKYSHSSKPQPAEPPPVSEQVARLKELNQNDKTLQ